MCDVPDSQAQAMEVKGTVLCVHLCKCKHANDVSVLRTLNVYEGVQLLAFVNFCFFGSDVWFVIIFPQELGNRGEKVNAQRALLAAHKRYAGCWGVRINRRLVSCVWLGSPSHH